MKKKKLLPHRVFVFGHPSRYVLQNRAQLCWADDMWCCSCKCKNERNENENYYLLWWLDNKQGLRSLLLSRSLGPITSSTVFSYQPKATQPFVNIDLACYKYKYMIVFNYVLTWRTIITFKCHYDEKSHLCYHGYFKT